MIFFIISVIVAVVSGMPLNDDNNRIIGGHPASPGQFPYQSSIRYKPTDEHVCGGIIINERTVLTAAHCFFGFSTSDVSIVTGTNLLNSSGDRYQAIEFHIHPEFHFLNIHNDVAVVIVDRTIEMNDKVQTIPLSTGTTGGDVEVILSGWGTTILDGESPNELQTIELLTITNEECSADLGDFKEIIDSQICTLTREGEGPCHGDSGSALTANGEAVGIVSWAIPCAKGRPDVYSRVSSFISWIDEHKFQL